MAHEPQRHIEQDLLAYKQRRREQAGPPLELHPATRRMLQSEAARTASRPLLTSEEAAKNFVRSFVMSHQQPGFFARHQRRIIWGGALFACLAVVLAVLRNDPRLVEQQRTFTDQLPTPPPAPAPQPTLPQSGITAHQPKAEGELSARVKQRAPAADKFQEVAKSSAAPANVPATTSPRPSTLAAAPLSAVQRAAADRSSAVAASAPTAPQGAAQPEQAVTRARTMDGKLAEKPAEGEGAQLVRALKAPEVAEAKSESGAKGLAVVSKAKLADEELQRAPLAKLTSGAGGGASPTSALVAASAPPQLAALAVTEAAPVRQQFQQLDSRAGYRQNFNSPPVPQVMQNFAFERTGDRVRIVDADGSTYVGTVMPAPTEESRLKEAAKLDASGQQAQSADPPTAYRFSASGVNRKLNQSVAFRGEWQPAVPTQAPPTTPALQPASLGIRLERLSAEKKELAPGSNYVSGNATTALNFNPQPAQNAAPPARISGRAVVGGKNEFEINAVPK